MISIIDYGMGNLRSVQKGLERVGLVAQVTNRPEETVTATGVILPGVGAFKDAIANLRRTGMAEALREVVQQRIPLLGICLGMQLLFTESEENGNHQGLDIIPGRVVRFPYGEKVPHMGWNQLHQARPSPLFTGIPNDSYFYFVHSYRCIPQGEESIGICHYGMDFCCAVQKNNILGCQFHPEKSSALGLQILRNFGYMINE